MITAHLDVDWQAIIAAAPVLTNGEAMGLVMFGDTFQQSTSTNTQNWVSSKMTFQFLEVQILFESTCVSP